MEKNIYEDLQLLTVADTMKLLKVSKNTVYNYLNSGALKSIKIGHARRITPEALREFIYNREYAFSDTQKAALTNKNETKGQQGNE